MNAIGPKSPLRVPDAPVSRPAAESPAEGAPGAPAGAAAPAHPPVAEATLWDLLSTEERAFFTQQAALGPLTYRPDGGTRGGSPLPTGRRIDVRG